MAVNRDGGNKGKRKKATDQLKEVPTGQKIRVSVGDPDWDQTPVKTEWVDDGLADQRSSRMRVLGWLVALVGLLAIMVAVHAIYIGDRERLGQVWEVVKAAIMLIVGWAIGTVGAEGKEPRPG